ncbi:MAG: glycosyltransferase family 4 protein [Beijerinckiaceae bacterium]
MLDAVSTIKKVLIVTDAWRPQVNGVVQTYLWLQRELPRIGVEVEFLTPDGFKTFAMPTYPEIRLARTTTRHVGNIVDSSRADFVHIATEGPLGWHAQRHCRKHHIPFSTCYHTRYPEYIAARFPAPLAWSYAVLRRFHNAAAVTMAATEQLAEELRERGFARVAHWRRGIDVAMFRSGPVAEFDWPRPYFLFVGRLAIEKNIEDFLKLDLPGTKVLAGDGPARDSLQKRYPAAKFLGAKYGQDLASIYRTADVFVFPSRTDTFGLVMAEALAAGVPVAAYPSAGAQTILAGTDCGIQDTDLRKAALAALSIDRDLCRQTGSMHSIGASARSFLEIMQRAKSSRTLIAE